MTVCEEAEDCQEEMNSLRLNNEATICTQKETIEIEECFMGVKSGCEIPSLAENCLEETHTGCSQNPEHVYCDATGNDCVEIFSNGLCMDNVKTSYHGPFCEIPKECQEEFCLSNTVIVDEVTPVGHGGEITLPEGCQRVEDHQGVEENELFYTKSIVCEEKSYCKIPSASSRLGTLCIPPQTSTGNDIIVTKGEDGERIQCDDETAQNFGDYWCPEGFRYFEGVCEFDTDVCDKGFTGHLENGCDTPFVPSDDALWELYQEQCFSQSPNIPSGMDVYDKACCYDAVFNNFEIWQANYGNTYVKVY